ncbi:IS630 family transposase [Candidatus Woesearchaeota archaeon]|nr:IS630 family transposase [Candidatus Woesearchaeota archaeon]
MWALNKGKSFLPRVSLERLNSLYSKEHDAKAKLRLLAAIRRKKGESIDDIAWALEKSRRTIHGWLTRFQERGLKAKFDEKRSGRPSYLTHSQLKNLRQDLLKGPPHDPAGLWLMNDVKQLLKKKYGVIYCRENIFKTLKRLGLSFQKPRPQHYKVDKKEQEKFKKKQSSYPHTTEVVGGWSLASMSVQ